VRIRSLSGGALLALVLLVGCKSSETSDGGVDAARDLPPGPCGDAATCPTGELCVSHQDGTSVTCTAVPANGNCPAGTLATSNCPDGGPPGCLGGGAVTYGCQTRPAGCATLSCACATALCAPDSCIAAANEHVACGSQ